MSMYKKRALAIKLIVIIMYNEYFYINCFRVTYQKELQSIQLDHNLKSENLRSIQIVHNSLYKTGQKFLGRCKTKLHSRQ